MRVISASIVWQLKLLVWHSEVTYDGRSLLYLDFLQVNDPPCSSYKLFPIYWVEGYACLHKILSDNDTTCASIVGLFAQAHYQDLDWHSSHSSLVVISFQRKSRVAPQVEHLWR